MNRTVNEKQALGILGAGIAFLAAAFTFSLYSVPSEVPGLPSFPFFSLPFPLISLLIALGSAFIAMGWIFHPRGTLGQVIAGSAVFVAGGVIWALINFVTAIPVDLGDITIYVEPYGAHASLVLAVGPLLAIFGLVFWALNHFEKRRDKELSEETQPSTHD